MADMQAVNEQDQRLWQLGAAWVRAIMDGALEPLERFCHPEVVSYLLTPNKYVTLDNSADLAAKFRQWFGECSDFHIEQSRVEMVGGKLGIFYRFLLLEQGAWYVVEQQLYCTVQDGRITDLHLLCSGFQPAPGLLAAPMGEPVVGEVQVYRDALLELHTGTAKNGSTCAVLTPAIKTKLREMDSGQVLEVRVDDPSAREDIEAWCRLSGNLLLRMSEGGRQELRFFVKKK